MNTFIFKFFFPAVHYGINRNLQESYNTIFMEAMMTKKNIGSLIVQKIDFRFTKQSLINEVLSGTHNFYCLRAPKS